jgi:hypothetical protein
MALWANVARVMKLHGGGPDRRLDHFDAVAREIFPASLVGMGDLYPGVDKLRTCIYLNNDKREQLVFTWESPTKLLVRFQTTIKSLGTKTVGPPGFIEYAGRSDEDLKTQLKKCVTELVAAAKLQQAAYFELFAGADQGTLSTHQLRQTQAAVASEFQGYTTRIKTLVDDPFLQNGVYKAKPRQNLG